MIVKLFQIWSYNQKLYGTSENNCLTMSGLWSREFRDRDRDSKPRNSRDSEKNLRFCFCFHKNIIIKILYVGTCGIVGLNDLISFDRPSPAVGR